MYCKYEGKDLFYVTEIIGDMPKHIKKGIRQLKKQSGENVKIFKEVTNKLMYMLGITRKVLKKPYVVKSGDVYYIHYHSNTTNCSLVFEYKEGKSFRVCLGEDINKCDDLQLDEIVSYYCGDFKKGTIKDFYELDKAIQMSYIISLIDDVDNIDKNDIYTLTA